MEGRTFVVKTRRSEPGEVPPLVADGKPDYMIELKQFLGKEIQVLIPFVNGREFRPVILQGVENGGIWITGKEINAMVHRAQKTQMLASMPVLFVPFGQIDAILQTVEGVKIPDKVLSG